MDFFRDVKEQNAFQTQLRPEAFELYQSFCVWRGMMGVESTVTAMVDWMNRHFGEVFILDDFNAMLRNNWMDTVAPLAPVTAPMFDALVGWTQSPQPAPDKSLDILAPPAPWVVTVHALGLLDYAMPEEDDDEYDDDEYLDLIGGDLLALTDAELLGLIVKANRTEPAY